MCCCAALGRLEGRGSVQECELRVIVVPVQQVHTLETLDPVH